MEALASREGVEVKALLAGRAPASYCFFALGAFVAPASGSVRAALHPLCAYLAMAGPGCSPVDFLVPKCPSQPGSRLPRTALPSLLGLPSTRLTRCGAAVRKPALSAEAAAGSDVQDGRCAEAGGPGRGGGRSGGPCARVQVRRYAGGPSLTSRWLPHVPPPPRRNVHVGGAGDGLIRACAAYQTPERRGVTGRGRVERAVAASCVGPTGGGQVSGPTAAARRAGPAAAAGRRADMVDVPAG